MVQLYCTLSTCYVGYFYNGKERYLNAIADVAELHATVKVLKNVLLYFFE